jgi:hypothetical protein
VAYDEYAEVPTERAQAPVTPRLARGPSLTSFVPPSSWVSASTYVYDPAKPRWLHAATAGAAMPPARHTARARRARQPQLPVSLGGAQRLTLPAKATQRATWALAAGPLAPRPLSPLPQAQVRYKPGFATAWRHHRATLRALHSLGPMRQWRLTRFVGQLRSLTGFSFVRMLSLSLGRLAPLSWLAGAESALELVRRGR